MQHFVRPDSKGRISLGDLAKGVSSFGITVTKDQSIRLEPMIEIPKNEKWLQDNEVALNSLKRGLRDAAHGKIKKAGDFSKYVDSE